MTFSGKVAESGVLRKHQFFLWLKHILEVPECRCGQSKAYPERRCCAGRLFICFCCRHQRPGSASEPTSEPQGAAKPPRGHPQNSLKIDPKSFPAGPRELRPAQKCGLYWVCGVGLVLWRVQGRSGGVFFAHRASPGQGTRRPGAPLFGQSGAQDARLASFGEPRAAPGSRFAPGAVSRAVPDPLGA